MRFVRIARDAFNTLNECLTITTGLIEAACERTVVLKSKGNANLTNGVLEVHSPTSKSQNGNGFISSNGSLNGVCPNGNGVYVDGEV